MREGGDGRRVVLDGAQAQPGRRGLGAGVRDARARARRDAARDDGPGARARAGAWQAEWEPLLELLRVTGSAAAWAAQLAGGLEIDADRMAANLAGAPVAEGDPSAAAALVARALEARTP